MRYLPHALILFVFVAVPSGLFAQQLQCGPCRAGFGLTQIGTSKTYKIQLSNAGSKPLTIRSKSITGPGFSFGNFPLPVVLGPGTTIRLPLVFLPTAAGRVNGVATLGSNALNPTLTVNLTGKGFGANDVRLAISPATLDFGSVTLGSSATLQATLSALNGDVTVSSAQTDNPEFSIQGLALPVTIPSGQGMPVTIQFTPSASGQATGNFIVQSNAVDSPASAALKGSGVAAGSHEADMSWNASNGAVGYNVYRGNAHGGPYSLMNSVLDASTNYADTSVVGGATYFYVATAVNSDGNESVYSNEAKVVIPK
jgi:hypothetical protein